MSGRVKTAIDLILVRQSNGNAQQIPTSKIRLIMQGIDPDLWHEASPDDPAMLWRVERAAREIGVSLPADLIAESATRNTGAPVSNNL